MGKFVIAVHRPHAGKERELLEAVEEAHRNEAVLEMWGRFNEACECQSLSTLDESSDQFAMFDPVGI